MSMVVLIDMWLLSQVACLSNLASFSPPQLPPQSMYLPMFGLAGRIKKKKVTLDFHIFCVQYKNHLEIF